MVGLGSVVVKKGTDRRHQRIDQKGVSKNLKRLGQRYDSDSIGKNVRKL